MTGSPGHHRLFHPLLATSSPQVREDGLERPRTDPKFLHSNATSHKWTIGAIAELLDNAYDQMGVVGRGVVIRIDVRKGTDGPMLSVRDNGGGMDAGGLLRMMSFGNSNVSTKRIGRYGHPRPIPRRLTLTVGRPTLHPHRWLSRTRHLPPPTLA